MRSGYASLLILLSSLSCTAQTRGQDWLVIGVVGKWNVVGTNKAVSFGMPVGPGTSLSRDTSTGNKTFGSVTIMLNGTHVTYSCDDPKTLPDHSNAGCVNPIPLASAPDLAAHAGEGGNWLQSLVKMISPDPERYYTTVSRGSGVLQDAVIAKTGQSVDLKPAFGSLNKGEYRVSVQKLDPDKKPVALTDTPSVLHWDPDKNSASELPPMTLGLYQMHVDTSDGEAVGDTWVLVVSPSDLPGKTAAFANVLQTTSGWGPSVPASGVRAINRAALDQLSR
jgi:hypothetical protein